MQHVGEYVKEDILELLDRSQKAVERALVVIFERQTYDEQRADATRAKNGMGFNGVHARYGSYLAKWLLSGKHLSDKHVEKARKLAKHYWRQLAEIANNRAQHNQKEV